MATQPAKTTKAAAPKEAKPKPVELDFTKLVVTDVQDSAELKHVRGSKYDNSPVRDWLRESYENEKGKQVPVPDQASADALEQALRSLAARMKIGVKVVVVDAANGSKIVKFMGKPPRKYQPRKAKEATA